MKNKIVSFYFSISYLSRYYLQCVIRNKEVSGSLHARLFLLSTTSEVFAKGDFILYNFTQATKYNDILFQWLLNYSIITELLNYW